MKSTTAQPTKAPSGEPKDNLPASNKKATNKSLEEENSKEASLFDALCNEYQLFHSQDREPCIKLKVGDHHETWPLLSQEFKWLFSKFCYDHIGKMVSAKIFKEELLLLVGRALFNAPRRRTFLRIARHNNDVYLDLTNAKWEQIKISKNGTEIISCKKSPVPFKRTPLQAPLPHPVKGGSLKTLKEILNLESEHEMVLLVSWLVGSANPDGPYVILILQGEQGSKKSTTANLIRDLIDPSIVRSRALFRTDRDLAIAANSNWILSYDNLSDIRVLHSDAFCRLSTGGGFGTRQLRTDKTEVFFTAKRPIILNGITGLAGRPDVADRAIVLNLSSLPDSKRKTEKELLKTWDEEKPRLLGALCEAISFALRNYDNVKLHSPPRMADFVHWILAAEPALPWRKGAFLEHYELNREQIVDAGLEDDPVGTTILQFVEKTPHFEGTATQLLKALSHVADSSIKKHKDWPKLPNSLSHRLMRISAFLRKRGIQVERHNTRPRLITITKVSASPQVIKKEGKPLPAKPSINRSPRAKKHSKESDSSKKENNNKPGRITVSGDTDNEYDSLPEHIKLMNKKRERGAV